MLPFRQILSESIRTVKNSKDKIKIVNIYWLLTVSSAVQVLNMNCLLVAAFSGYHWAAISNPRVSEQTFKRWLSWGHIREFFSRVLTGVGVVVVDAECCQVRGGRSVTALCLDNPLPIRTPGALLPTLSLLGSLPSNLPLDEIPTGWLKSRHWYQARGTDKPNHCSGRNPTEEWDGNASFLRVLSVSEWFSWMCSFHWLEEWKENSLYILQGWGLIELTVPSFSSPICCLTGFEVCVWECVCVFVCDTECVCESVCVCVCVCVGCADYGTVVHIWVSFIKWSAWWLLSPTLSPKVMNSMATGKGHSLSRCALIRIN